VRDLLFGKSAGERKLLIPIRPLGRIADLNSLLLL
jgi:hypothetical protein